MSPTASRTTTPTASPTAPQRAAAWLRGWLARPLTSFHLVLAVFALLTGIGLVMVLSASSAEAAAAGSPFSLFQKQLIFVLLGAVLFGLALRTPLRVVRRLAAPAVIVSIVLLLVVLIPEVGVEVNGTRGWFKFHGFSFQPAEAAKIAVAVWGASVLATRRPHLSAMRALFSPLLPVASTVGVLILVEPDLGSTVTLAIIVGALLWFGGLPVKWFLGMAATVVAGSIVFGLTVGPRSARIESWLHPNADLSSTGYQALQSRYSLADGGLFGVGLGQSRAKWNYLPNAHNDFIFAIIGEELGFVGAAMVLVLFGVLTWVGLRISLRSVDPFLVLLSATTTVWLVGQAFLNIGYVIGLLPVTGLQLPMISSGGTSTALTMFMFGLLANAARHEPAAVAALRGGDHGRLARLLRLPPPAPYLPRRAPRRLPGAVPPPRATGGGREGARPGTGGRSTTRPADAPTNRTVTARAAAPRRAAPAPRRGDPRPSRARAAPTARPRGTRR
ncbi:MAG: putative lipid II flippase FtsW [Mycobacteriaceae bacterium]